MRARAEKAEAALSEAQFAEYVERAADDLQYWKARAEKAEARIAGLERERDEADRDCSLIIGWAAAADGEPDVMLNEFHALRARIAKLEIAVDAAEATEEALYSRIVAERARAEKAEAALAVEQAQVLAALQERDDLAVAFAEARRGRERQHADDQP